VRHDEVLILPARRDGRLLLDPPIRHCRTVSILAILSSEQACDLFQARERDILGSANVGVGELAANLAVRHHCKGSGSNSSSVQVKIMMWSTASPCLPHWLTASTTCMSGETILQ
jgi:hypothetical protein